jgi:tRNA threonylcarbamoyladenosine biosynthesis protein TsaE
MDGARAIVVRTNGPEQTRSVGTAFAASLPAGATLSLSGPLGAGKTVLVRGLCEGLGVVDDVTSPTFTLVNEYAAGNGARIIHVDCFRLAGPAELEDLALEDRRGKHTVMVVEWGDRVADALPPDTIRVSIEPDESAGDDARRISIRLPEGVTVPGLSS